MATSPDTAAGSPWPNTTPSDNSASPMTAKGVLEWVVYYVEESLHDSVFPEEYGQDYSLTDVAMFYPDRLEKEGLKTPAFLGLDLQTSLAGAIYDARTFEQAHNVTEGLEAPDQKELKAEVETMMDAELQKFGIDLQAKQLDFLSKAGTISRYRQIKMASATGPPKSKYIKRGKEHEFEAHLEYLMGGHSGSSRHSILYFEYNTSFDFFLRALQHQTVLCTIPPIDFTKPPPIEPPESLPNHPSYPRSAGSFGRKDPSRKSPASESDSGKVSTDTEGTSPQPTIPATKPEPRRRSVDGYTLKDGPWTYQPFQIDSNSVHSDRENRRSIHHEGDYLNMVADLRKANRGPGDAKHCISIMHSLEYEIKNIWVESQRIDERAGRATTDMLFEALEARTAEEVEEDNRGLKSLLEELGIEEFRDDEFGDSIGWMDDWQRKNGSAGSL